MKIVVAFALESEFAPWRRACRFRRVLTEDNAVYEARIAGAEVRAVLTGVGPRNINRIMRSAFRDVPDVCISSGLAGALTAQHGPGEIVAARAVRTTEGDHVVQSDADLLGLAVTCGAKVVDLFHTSKTIVLKAEEKSRMGVLADAVEMESFGIMSEALACGVPSVAIRAIGDPVDMDLPLDFNRVLDEQGRVSFPLVLAQIAQAPRRLPALIRFGFKTRQAVGLLARFLNQYLQALASHRKAREMVSQIVAV